MAAAVAIIDGACESATVLAAGVTSIAATSPMPTDCVRSPRES